ncbi:zinc finger and SCAN domain-containing protein 12-like [Chrysoperla carnea]|uniref:zinc finger and SCAN domain-containing protein 12-like n=1 Tax=Chrysoperla carnea TaxID=189513 RepID=UPI001D08B0B6|nr:zinc finger and SCAN domain-containing protein 12-like [Chrysoperla carnea]
MANNSIVDTNNDFFINEEKIKLEKELHIESVIIKNETLDNDVIMEGGQIKNEEGSNDIDSVVSVKLEPVHEDLYTETIFIKNEPFDDNVTIEDERIKNEVPEEGSNVIGSDMGVKHEPDEHTDHQHNLVKHKRIRNAENSFSCDICSLIRHKRIHNGEQSFSCDRCNKTFKHQAALVQHKWIHNSEEKLTLTTERSNLKTYSRSKSTNKETK